MENLLIQDFMQKERSIVSEMNKITDMIESVCESDDVNKVENVRTLEANYQTLERRRELAHKKVAHLI